MISLKEELYQVFVILPDGNSALKYVNAETSDGAIKLATRDGSLVVKDSVSARTGNTVHAVSNITGLKLSLWERLFPVVNFKNYCGAR